MEELKNHKLEFLRILKEYISQINPQDFGEEELMEAISYSLIDEGAKYVRSFLVFETGKMLNATNFEEVKKLAIAIEMLHAYSLIHDDLPSVDNSDFRRGRPSCHIAFTESTALLAGSALEVMAFEVLLSINNSKPILQEFCKVAGLKGILSGQILDLNKEMKKQEFDIMNYKKTCLLFEFCVVSVAILCNREDLITNLKEYAKNLGIAFQMQDDLLDAGEDSYSYLLKFKTKEALQTQIQNVIYACQKAIVDIPLNEVLSQLPNVLSKRKF
jgi:geranylgeranyl pyrophosphate synthase